MIGFTFEAFLLRVLRLVSNETYLTLHCGKLIEQKTKTKPRRRRSWTQSLKSRFENLTKISSLLRKRLGLIGGAEGSHAIKTVHTNEHSTNGRMS